jgi:hypothetical protein
MLKQVGAGFMYQGIGMQVIFHVFQLPVFRINTSGELLFPYRAVEIE